MKRQIKIYAFLLIVTLNLIILTDLNQPEKFQDICSSDSILYIKTDSPIDIQNNTALAALASTGNGSASNPYILENYVINANGLGVDGILINNTNAYFILRNSTIMDVNVGGGSGIRLQNVSHARLINNTVFNAPYGIMLSLSHNNTVLNNNVSKNWLGLNIVSSENNTINENTANNCTTGGIRLVDYSNNNTLHKNTVNYNKQSAQSGIFLWINSSWNTLTDNTANYNNGPGICLESFCDGNTLTGNTVNYNEEEGIILSDSSNGNNLTKNTANGNNIGIRLAANCDDNNFTNNIITYHLDYGVFIASNCNGNYFYRNIAFQNKDGMPVNQIIDQGGNSLVENLVNASDDFDGDDLVNSEELSWGTSPFMNDTDIDGLNDWAEIITYFTNATNPDSDGDGLNDGAEIITYFTNATNPDSDADGLSDYNEIIIQSTDPLDADSDDDLIPDGWEVSNSISPLNPLDASIDIELDGLTNIQEFFYNTDPRDVDSDDDGYSDGAEVTAGTNPLDPNDFPSESIPPDYTLPIIIAGIAIAVAILVHGFLQRSRPVAPLPHKQLNAPKRSKVE